MYEEILALNNPKWLIYHQTKLEYTAGHTSTMNLLLLLLQIIIIIIIIIITERKRKEG